MLTRKVPDENNLIKDIIENYKNLACNNALAFNNTCLGNRLNQVLPTNRLMQDLNLANDTTHCTMFCQRVHSKMIF